MCLNSYRKTTLKVFFLTFNLIFISIIIVSKITMLFLAKIILMKSKLVPFDIERHVFNMHF